MKRCGVSLGERHVIREASTLPLSIIIIGIGNSSFVNMKRLDADRTPNRRNEVPSRRDIVQFVPLRKFNSYSDRALLGREVLAEVPLQVVTYMRSRGFRPKLPPPHGHHPPPMAPQSMHPNQYQQAQVPVPPVQHSHSSTYPGNVGPPPYYAGGPTLAHPHSSELMHRPPSGRFDNFPAHATTQPPSSSAYPYQVDPYYSHISHYPEPQFSPSTSINSSYSSHPSPYHIPPPHAVARPPPHSNIASQQDAYSDPMRPSASPAPTLYPRVEYLSSGASSFNSTYTDTSQTTYDTEPSAPPIPVQHSYAPMNLEHSYSNVSVGHPQRPSQPSASYPQYHSNPNM